MDYAVLKDTILKLKKQIIRTEAGDAQLSETDTRQGLRMCPEVRGKRTAHLDSVIRVSDQAATSACSRTSLRRW